MRRHSRRDHGGGWILFWIVVLVLIVTFVIIVTTHPYPIYPYYRNSSPYPHRDSHGRSNCTVGEVYDSDLYLCAPTVTYPMPISRDIMDESVEPCESFYRHMNGKWLDSHMNENRGFTYVYRRNQKHIHDIIRNPESGPVYRFYRSCLDTLVNHQHVIFNNAQLNHVKEYILGSIENHADLPVAFARLAKYGFASPFSLTIEMHPTQLEMVPLIQFDTLQKHVDLIDADALYVINYLESLYTDEPFKGSFVDYVRSDRYQSDMITMGSLLDVSPVNFWKLYLRELNGYRLEEDLDTADQPLWLLDKQYMRHLLAGDGLRNVPMHQWKAYIEYSIMYHSYNFLPNLPADSYFRVHSPIRREHLRHRLKRSDSSVHFNEHSCLSITHKLLPGMIGNMFLHLTMPDHHRVRQKVQTVVENVRDSFARLVSQTPWLSNHTREIAVDKLRSIIVRSVVPTYYETEPFADRLTMDNYLRNLNIIRQYFATRNFELWTKGAPNRDIIQRFGAPLSEVNAFYSPVSNTITIFAGILHEPFYSDRYSDTALYATIGMIAGHELGHALDNTGRLFDKDGSLSIHEPWSTEEYAEFQSRSTCITEEYKAPQGCNNVAYGQQTLGEDLADINGIRSAYYARFPNKESGSDLERRQFFSIFAQMWAENYDKKTLCDRVNDDEHAIALFRVDKTLRQMPEFQSIFNCKSGDGMVNDKPCIIY